MKQIEITVFTNGETKVETTGFVGGECVSASRFIEQALGLTAIDTLKPEYHQASQLNSEQTRQS